MSRRWHGIINAAATRYNVLLDPDLLNTLLTTGRDSEEPVGEAAGDTGEDETVPNTGHLEVS